jgi:hypothetical protein
MRADCRSCGKKIRILPRRIKTSTGLCRECWHAWKKSGNIIWEEEKTNTQKQR